MSLKNTVKYSYFDEDKELNRFMYDSQAEVEDAIRNDEGNYDLDTRFTIVKITPVADVIVTLELKVEPTLIF